MSFGLSLSVTSLSRETEYFILRTVHMLILIQTAYILFSKPHSTTWSFATCPCLSELHIAQDQLAKLHVICYTLTFREPRRESACSICVEQLKKEQRGLNKNQFVVLGIWSIEHLYMFCSLS